MRRIVLPATKRTPAGSRSRLAWARVISGMTQAQLGEALGLSPAWVSGVEHGALVPTLQQKVQIVKILKMDFETILGEER
jgi:transcriptional regulator with XRE-family HTH domain